MWDVCRTAPDSSAYLPAGADRRHSQPQCTQGLKCAAQPVVMRSTASVTLPTTNPGSFIASASTTNGGAPLSPLNIVRSRFAQQQQQQQQQLAPGSGDAPSSPFAAQNWRQQQQQQGLGEAEESSGLRVAAGVVAASPLVMDALRAVHLPMPSLPRLASPPLGACSSHGTTTTNGDSSKGSCGGAAAEAALRDVVGHCDKALAAQAVWSDGDSGGAKEGAALGGAGDNEFSPPSLQTLQHGQPAQQEQQQEQQPVLRTPSLRDQPPRSPPQQQQQQQQRQQSRQQQQSQQQRQQQQQPGFTSPAAMLRLLLGPRTMVSRSTGERISPRSVLPQEPSAAVVPSPNVRTPASTRSPIGNVRGVWNSEAIGRVWPPEPPTPPAPSPPPPQRQHHHDAQQRQQLHQQRPDPQQRQQLHQQQLDPQQRQQLHQQQLDQQQRQQLRHQQPDQQQHQQQQQYTPAGWQRTHAAVAESAEETSLPALEHSNISEVSDFDAGPSPTARQHTAPGDPARANTSAGAKTPSRVRTARQPDSASGATTPQSAGPSPLRRHVDWESGADSPAKGPGSDGNLRPTRPKRNDTMYAEGLLAGPMRPKRNDTMYAAGLLAGEDVRDSVGLPQVAAAFCVTSLAPGHFRQPVECIPHGCKSLRDQARTLSPSCLAVCDDCAFDAGGRAARWGEGACTLRLEADPTECRKGHQKHTTHPPTHVLCIKCLHPLPTQAPHAHPGALALDFFNAQLQGL
eukprot:363234-Chlamydomonas_euryale.AAC.10